MTIKPLITTLLSALLATIPVASQNLLPKPQTFKANKGSFNINADKFKVLNLVGNDARNIYSSHVLDRHSLQAQHVVLLQHLNNASSPEAYRLHITTDTLSISAASAVAFLRAWQTIAQLSTKHGIMACDITDAPAYQWRSLMIDVSRHFFPISFLEKQVDIMAQYKFNYLHLHLTDAAGWRIEIKRYPRLTNFAAWRPQASWKEWAANGHRYTYADSCNAYGGYYTQDQLRHLVAYAAQRGITIVPEIEMPGHSEEVLTAYPELSCTHQPYQQADFCPGSIATYDFLENVLSEVISIFPSRYIHIGGDEAAKKSWGSCPLCQQMMRQLACDKDGLQAHLIARMGRFLQRHGRQLVGWDEVIAANLPANTTVMVWRDTQYAHRALQHGYGVVLSPGAYCYLDAYQDAPHTQPEAIGGYLPLDKVYAYVPGADLPEAEQSKIIGIQGNLWCEYVPTQQHAEYMLYPRALAIAETAWNGTKTKNFADFRKRALAHTALLRQGGVNAFCLKHEYGERPASLRIARHKARGCKVVYNQPYNNQYRAQGQATLTDGCFGGWAFGDGRWQGFIGKDYCMDVTVDLGSMQNISYIATDFMQSCGPEIYFPAEYRVSISSDNTLFKEIYSNTYPIEETPTSEYRQLSWRGKASARYIRIKAKAAKGWVFADEIVVK